jgi:alkylhydroperoxidase/carboxymuconolactone decarboxylase family protein YurZ
VAERPLDTIRTMDPEFMDHLRETDKVIYGDGALPRRVKLLIALALDAAHGASAGVRSLALAALNAGATRDEIAETVRVAYHLSGVGSVYTAAHGLKDLIDE